MQDNELVMDGSGYGREIKQVRTLLVRGLALSLAFAAAASAAQGTDYFESKIRPLLVSQCSACHGGGTRLAGLDLTNGAGLRKGADSGPVVTPGQPDRSRIIQVVRYQDRIKMPPTGRLSAEDIEALETWVRLGAPWPEESISEAAPGKKPGENAKKQEAAAHWAFQPVKDHEPPVVNDPTWARNPIDQFILAKLEAAGLSPAPPADKLTLLRRVKFDLHGLPPTAPEIKEFLADDHPEAFARLIERLLASPRYGEKWGRHWLDVARYADSTGVDEDLRLAHSWRYRDYVIDAFNRDLPFDRFVTEQLAGDLLPSNTPENPYVEGVVATGFLALGPKPVAQQDKVKLLYDVVDEQIDTVSKAFMGLTISCARCHDHKFDPILTKDYYSLASIFASTQHFEDIVPLVSKLYFAPLIPETQYRAYTEHQKKTESVNQRIDSIAGLELLRHVASAWEPNLAGYMLGARQVYDGGIGLEEAARQNGLDVKVLKKWVEYLEPGKEWRPYLDVWYQAEPARLEHVAREFQARCQATTKEQLHTLETWKNELHAALEAAGESPKKPKFEASKDRFYSEVYLSDKGPFTVPEEEQDPLLPRESSELVAKLRQEVKKLKENAPPEPPLASAVKDGTVVQQAVFIRGSHHSPGESVPKQFPVVLADENQRPITTGSGRLALARWLTAPDHPLTSRVTVNRLWHWHFGEGLVRTPDNFGVRGEAPTHPELLDYLARRFIDSGWSVKQMHRLIMLSNTYRMSSRVSDANWKADPPNRLWSRFERRRLTVEEMRDSMLVLDESLDFQMRGTLQVELDSYKFKDPYFHPDKTQRRTVYLPLYRNKLPGLLSLFDFVDATTASGKRNATNIAPQGLYAMNSEFMQKRARAFAEFLVQQPGLDTSSRIDMAYLRALGREPRPDEIDQAVTFVENYPGGRDETESSVAAWEGFCHVLLASNEYHYVD